VKYFNAEEHEEHRFGKALKFYQSKNINLAMSLAGLKISKDSVIAISLWASLSLAYLWFENGKLSVGGFVMFSSYNMQIYVPLDNMGNLWRIVRQKMVDVEQLLNILELNEVIPEVEYPKPLVI